MTDVFGRAILDYYNGDSKAFIKVISSMEGWHDIPVHYMFRSLNEMPTLELTAMRECKGSVLDVGAGAGSHALELQELGHEVVAIDNSPLAVKVMRRRGVQQAECMDYLEAIAAKDYDTYLMMMNGLGVVETVAGLKNLISKLRPMLEKGSQILCESSDLWRYLADENDTLEIDNSKAYYGEVSYDLEYKDMKKHEFKWLYIDTNTLTSIVKEFDLQIEVLFEGEWDNYLARIFA